MIEQMQPDSSTQPDPLCGEMYQRFNSRRLLPMHALRIVRLLALFVVAVPLLLGQSPSQPADPSPLVISRSTQPTHPFTVAGENGVIIGTQDGSFESWILPIKLFSHLTIEASLQGYNIPIEVNPQSAQIEVHPDHTTITYSHLGFTLRQIMFSPDAHHSDGPSTGPIVLFQIDAEHPVDLTFRFTPELRWMWPKRNEGTPSPEWVNFSNSTSARIAGGSSTTDAPSGIGGYILHLDYPDLAGAVAMPTATPGIMVPFQASPAVYPLELHLHYDPQRDGRGAQARVFPLLMAVGSTPETATGRALTQTILQLNSQVSALYEANVAQYAKLQAESTSIVTPDRTLNEAFQWGVVAIEQLKAREYVSKQTALVAGYYTSGSAARPGFGWFFGRDSLYSLYAVNGYGDFALTRSELEFLISRQRADGKIMHEFTQTAADPAVDWKSFPYMYAAADSTPLFLMAVRDYYRASGDRAFIEAHRDAIEKAWTFESGATQDSDGDGIYDNSQGTGWVEGWPHRMPHQEVYLALLDEQASQAYAALESGLQDSQKAAAAEARATAIHNKIESEYYDEQHGCYAFSHNTDGDPNGKVDKTSTLYPALAWWDSDAKAAKSPLAHPEQCLRNFAGPNMATDWGLRDVAITEPLYDGMSYHQGAVWPLFTGWGALAEYRANQPLPAQQMLMQNVDLTWAQDLGSVTEVLSGDLFVPFGRSSSHQLWSSSMVITPALRGLFGISLDAQANTITLNPHLPADWNHAEIKNLHIGNDLVHLTFNREKGYMQVGAKITGSSLGAQATAIKLRSDVAGAKDKVSGSKPDDLYSEIAIPLHPVELILPAHALPAPGSRPGQMKVISSEYGAHKLTLVLEGQPDTTEHLYLRENISIAGLNVKLEGFSTAQNSGIRLTGASCVKDPCSPEQSQSLEIHFPKGQGWQTAQVSLNW